MKKVHGLHLMVFCGGKEVTSEFWIPNKIISKSLDESPADTGHLTELPVFATLCCESFRWRLLFQVKRKLDLGSPLWLSLISCRVGGFSHNFQLWN